MKNHINKFRKMLFLSIILVNISSVNFTSDNYVLRAKTGRIYSEGANNYLVATTILTNHTSDTLRYLSWSCSYQEFYIVKSEMLTEADYICTKNLPCVKVLPPNRSDSVSLTFKIKASYFRAPIKYKIGMKLAKDNLENEKNQWLEKPMKYTLF